MSTDRYGAFSKKFEILSAIVGKIVMTKKVILMTWLVKKKLS